MILGRGTARTDGAIVAEYQRFLAKTQALTDETVFGRVSHAPEAMLAMMANPIARWTDAEVKAFFKKRHKSTRYYYGAFVSYLIFKGYYQPSLTWLVKLPFDLVRMHRPALCDIRQRIVETEHALGYRSRSSAQVGTQLKLLILFLAHTGKTLEETTRDDFDAFRDAYQGWYRQARCRKDGRPDARLFHLERQLVFWEQITPRQHTFRHERHFAEIQHAAIRNGILLYMKWCDAKYRPSTIHSCRAGIYGFFLWFQREYPGQRRLDAVNRSVALEYASHLHQKATSGDYAAHYVNDLYRRIRLFFDFVIEESVPTAPVRNPFLTSDVARVPDPLPRYMTDQEVQSVLRYCEQHGSLFEWVIVLLLLHTGIRAGELAALKATDVVQIQGRWRLHIHQGKGLKDRVIPLTPQCLAALQAWQQAGWERTNEYLFTRFARHYTSGGPIQCTIRRIGERLGIAGLTPHRFRHTFAVSLLNYGMRESALQKLMGHATVSMTLYYAKVLDTTVEQSFNTAIDKMRSAQTMSSPSTPSTSASSTGLDWVPRFFTTADFGLFAEGDTLSWIRLPHGYCRRNPQLNCESDVKCLICDRFAATPEDLPKLREMLDRFNKLGMTIKAKVVAAQIQRIESPQSDEPIGLPVLR